MYGLVPLVQSVPDRVFDLLIFVAGICAARFKGCEKRWLEMTGQERGR
jgi:hypothetical protein